MKIIDEKGKLFGKLNIIDLLVVLLAIAVAAVLVAKRSGGDGGDPGGAPVTLTYQTLIKGVDPRYYDSVRQFVDPAEGKKDQLLSNSSLLNGFVVDCQATPHVEYINTDDGQVKRAQSEEDDRVDLLFTIEVQVDDGTTNTVGSQQVRVGSSHIVKTAHFEFSGTYVISADWTAN